MSSDLAKFLAAHRSQSQKTIGAHLAAAAAAAWLAAAGNCSDSASDDSDEHEQSATETPSQQSLQNATRNDEMPAELAAACKAEEERKAAEAAEAAET